MKLTREIHVGSRITFGRAQELAPDVKLESGNGTAPGETWALGFLDPAKAGGDREVHLFLLDEKGKEKLLEQLTGGIVLARSVPSA